MKPILGIHALVASALFAVLTVCTPGAHAQTYSNTAPINFASSISDGRATLYPSPISVLNAPASIGYVSVTLKNYSHTWADDVNVLLVSPTGQKILLMANTNGTGDAVNDTLTFIPDGTAMLPLNNTNVESGLYACSVYNAPASLPSPAPAGPYGTSLSPLIGTNANGTWNLYVWDDVPSSVDGTFAGGWSISFNQTPALPVPTAFTYQGVLSSAGAPIAGSANVRFTLCNSPTVLPSVAAVAPAITRSFTGITAGQLTTSLDFGSVIDTNQALWLSIEVDSPPGSGFVTLSPRQPLTPVPRARLASIAAVATTAQSVPWSAITGVPANVSSAFSPWNPGLEEISYTLGRVGIGIASPDFSLHVASNDDTQIALTGGPAVGGNASPRTWSIQSSATVYPVGSQLNGSFQIVDRSASASRMLIDFDGNVGIGTTTPTQRLTVAGNVLANNIAVPSSGRFKHNVAPMTDALDKLLKLEGVSFDWNPDFAKDRPGREHDIGFVAEDVAKVFPEVVFYDAEGKVTGMDYSRLTAVAIQAIKQQQAKFAAELAKRDAQNAELKARLDRLEQLLKESHPSQR